MPQAHSVHIAGLNMLNKIVPSNSLTPQSPFPLSYMSCGCLTSTAPLTVCTFAHPVTPLLSITNVCIKPRMQMASEMPTGYSNYKCYIIKTACLQLIKSVAYLFNSKVSAWYFLPLNLILLEIIIISLAGVKNIIWNTMMFLLSPRRA